MARRGRQPRRLAGDGGPVQTWLITYCDLMTLLMTFFIMLVGMSVFDDQRRLSSLTSVLGALGAHEPSGATVQSPLQQVVAEVADAPLSGPEPLPTSEAEDNGQELRYAAGKYVQIVSVGADLLFAPGVTGLTPAGEALLRRLLPVLAASAQPILVAGHSAGLREELGQDYRPGAEADSPDRSWTIAMDRGLAVYLWLLDQGLPAERLRLEAFGRFHPAGSEDTAAGRRRNRRVDLVLDARIPGFATALPASPSGLREGGRFDYKGFVFDLDKGTPAANATEGR